MFIYFQLFFLISSNTGRLQVQKENFIGLKKGKKRIETKTKSEKARKVLNEEDEEEEEEEEENNSDDDDNYENECNKNDSNKDDNNDNEDTNDNDENENENETNNENVDKNDIFLSKKRKFRSILPLDKSFSAVLFLSLIHGKMSFEDLKGKIIIYIYHFFYVLPLYLTF